MHELTMSIKEKIITSCAIVSVIMAVMLIVTVYLLNYMQTKITMLEKVTKLEDYVQELRRCEKNLFLYRDPSFGKKALFLSEEAQRTLSANRMDFNQASSPKITESFNTNLSNYKKSIPNYLNSLSSDQRPSAPGKPTVVEESIRSIGSQLSNYAQLLAKNERSHINRTKAFIISIQIGQLLLFGLLMIGFWLLIFRKIVRPLRVLEEFTGQIGKGNFEVIESRTEEPEVRQVFDSLNRMSEELQKSQVQLVRSESYAALGTLVAGVAHEVNTPLSTIRLHSEVLLEELDEIKEQEFASSDFFRKKLSSIIREADRTLKIVHDLLQLSPGKSLTMESMKLKEPLSKAIDFLGSQIPADVEIRIDVGDDIEIHGDGQRMTTVFMNLITNAIAAIDGKGSVTIKAYRTEDGLVDVSVIDTGKGIAEEELNKIFDPFFTTKENEKGKGLGLSITHEIVTAHKGRIWAESIPGKGTTMKLQLPAGRGSE